MSSPRLRRRLRVRLPAWGLTVSLAAALWLVGSSGSIEQGPEPSTAIGGPYGRLLYSSTDLGRSRAGRVQLTVALPSTSKPEPLLQWAQRKRLWVRWQAGSDWAIVEGEPAAVSAGFDISIHDYRGMQGQVFYASPEQPGVPMALRDSVSDLGRVLGFTPHHEAQPPMPLDLPRRGLTSSALLKAYNANPLAEAGHTGKS